MKACVAAPALTPYHATRKRAPGQRPVRITGQALELPVHVPDARVLELPDVVKRAFDVADVFNAEIPLDDATQASFAVGRIRDVIAADPRLAGRLALFGRRLMGEALSQAQRVAADRDALAGLLAGGVDHPGIDLAAIGRLFNRLTENHTQRMEALGLHA